MTRRRALWITGALSVLLLGVEAAFDVRMQDAGGHGIIDFELAGSLDHSRRILEFWGHDGHVAVWRHGPGEHMQALGVDAVIVGDQDSHLPVLPRRGPAIRRT